MKNQTIIWIAITFILLFPSTLGRFVIDMAGGLIIIALIMSICVIGVGWFSWRSLKANITTCTNCGSQYLSNSFNCPTCGSKQQISTEELNNIPASAATIDIEAKETK